MNTTVQAQNFQSSRMYGFLLIILSTTLFSFKAILIKLVYRYGATPDIVMALRMLFSMPLFLFIAISARRAYGQPIRGSTIAKTAVIGVFGYYIASAFDLYGLQYISASLERLILYVYPTIVMILSAMLLGHYSMICLRLVISCFPDNDQTKGFPTWRCSRCYAEWIGKISLCMDSAARSGIGQKTAQTHHERLRNCHWPIRLAAGSKLHTGAVTC